MTTQAKKSVLALVWDKFGSFSFVLPAVIIFSIFYIYPFIDIFHLSVHRWDGLAEAPREWVGMQHFIDVFTGQEERWWKSVVNAGYITFFALTLQNFLAFALALACDREMKMKNIYRVIFFIPPVLSQVVVGLVWKMIYHPGGVNNAGEISGNLTGILNVFLAKIGLAGAVSTWLADPDMALTCIAVVHSWQGFGWGFIMLLAGLQTIDRQLYEAARVDGAGPWTTFKNVTIPMMMPVILVVMILTILGSMQAFVIVLSMVGQYPGGETAVPVLEILGEMNNSYWGMAAAMGIIFAVILILTSALFKFLSSLVKQA